MTYANRTPSARDRPVGPCSAATAVVLGLGGLFRFPCVHLFQPKKELCVNGPNGSASARDCLERPSFTLTGAFVRRAGRFRFRRVHCFRALAAALSTE
jgi:hypothetical protein